MFYRLFAPNRREERLAQINTSDPANSHAVVEVSDYQRNASDAMGLNKRYWCLPFAPKDEQIPACDGINWQVRPL